MSSTTISPAEARRVILASSVGTVFEWYDFYLYGSLAVFFGGLFFPPGNPTAAFLASLATFGAGFAVRPFGALVFGRIGDMVGRKYTFLVTIVVMGLSTGLVGLMPTYEHVGIWAPIILVTLRLAQGLALGGEYGGAATYVAEHAPIEKRGFNTSWIQTTATFGFFLSLLVILVTRISVGEAGWHLDIDRAAVGQCQAVHVRHGNAARWHVAGLRRQREPREQRHDDGDGAAGGGAHAVYASHAPRGGCCCTPGKSIPSSCCSGPRATRRTYSSADVCNRGDRPRLERGWR